MTEKIRIEKIKVLRNTIEACARDEELTVAEVEIGMAAYNRELEAELVAEMALKKMKDSLEMELVAVTKNDTVKRGNQQSYIN